MAKSTQKQRHDAKKQCIPKTIITDTLDSDSYKHIVLSNIKRIYPNINIIIISETKFF